MNKYCFTFLLILGCFFSQAQDLILDLQRGIAPTDAVSSSITKRTNQRLKATNIQKPFQFVRTDAQDEGIVFLTLKPDVNAQILQAKADYIELAIPVDTEHELVLELHKKNILSPDFAVTTSSGKVDDTFADRSVFYHGKVKGLEEGWATLSVFEGEMTVFINSNKGQLTLGKITNEASYVFYNEQRVVTGLSTSCGVDDDLLDQSINDAKEKVDITNQKSANCPVGVYIEVDNEGFINYGQSVANTTTFTTNLFNQVIAVYGNINIPMELSGIKIWNTNDPYGNNNPQDFNTKGIILDNFATTLQDNYTGRLAHLVSIQEQGANQIVGVAALDVLCQTYATGGRPYGLTEVFNSFENYPTQSGSVSLLAHELGHNFGSQHTHRCMWGVNGNQAIDNCNTLEEGPCNVINDRNANPNYEGTIMSYCGSPGVLEFYTGGGAWNGPREVIVGNYLEAVNECLGNDCGNGGSNGTCASPIVLNCGDNVSGNTADGEDNFQGNYFGSELIYQFTAAAGPVDIQLTGSSADLDLFLFTDCNDLFNSIVEAGATINDNESINTTVTAGTYYILVDGWQGAQSNFNLALTCSGGGTCASPIVLNCGDNVMEDTNDGQNNIEDYGLGFLLTGPELIYEFQANTGELTASLTNLNADLDLILLSDCNDPTSVLASSTTGGNVDETISGTVNNAGTFYLVVDGFNGAASSFTLSLTCNGGGGSDCPIGRSVSSLPIASGLYQAQNTITSTGRVESGSNVTFEAGQSITLMAGFVAESGSTFTARIQACQPANEDEVAARSKEETRPLVANTTSLEVFPNPFQQQTTITYQLEKATTVALEIYDLNGRRIAQPVRNSLQEAGNYQVTFHADDQPKGIYLVFLRTDDAVISKRLVLME